MVSYKRLGLRVCRTGDMWTVYQRDTAGRWAAIYSDSGNKGQIIADCLGMLYDTHELNMVPGVGYTWAE